jgi:hypothetical protein
VLLTKLYFLFSPVSTQHPKIATVKFDKADFTALRTLFQQSDQRRTAAQTFASVKKL